MKFKNLVTLKEHKGAVYSICQGNQPFEVFSGGSDRHVILWDLQKLSPMKVVAKSPSPIISLLYLKGFNLLLIGQMEGGVHVIDLDAGKELRYLKIHEGYVFDIKFIESKNELVFSSGDGSISVWSVPDFKLLYQKKVTEKKCRKMAYSETRNELAVSNGNGSIAFFDVSDWSLKNTITNLPSAVNVVHYQPDSDYLVAGEKNAHLFQFELGSNREIKNIAAHNWAIYDMAFCENGKYLATASRDKTIKIWDAEQLKVLQRIEGFKDSGHTHSVNAILWLAYNNLLISAGDDQGLKVWKEEELNPGDV